ncbi:MAG: DNA alkylation repair protein [Bacilli bacterium]|nr:DNA alkylation repair protein [Bacilli bacterium]
MEIITKILFENQDLKYREFNSKLIPNISKDNIIGVRVPVIRKIAKEIKDNSYIEEFFNELPHKYQEENILHGILLSNYKDIDILLDKLDKFLVYADNWAVTDIISPKIFKKYPNKVLDRIKIWINSSNEYVIRFGVVSLLQFYLDENFTSDILEMVSKIKSDYFYVNMAIAWFYSFALIKQYETTIKYFEDKKLDKWIHNKSIQKAIDSYRISKEKKDYLRKLKIK